MINGLNDSFELENLASDCVTMMKFMTSTGSLPGEILYLHAYLLCSLCVKA